MTQNLNPPQFGAEVEFRDGDELTISGSGTGESPASTCARCDSSSRCGACGRSSSSSSCVNTG